MKKFSYRTELPPVLVQAMKARSVRAIRDSEMFRSQGRNEDALLCKVEAIKDMQNAIDFMMKYYKLFDTILLM